MIVVDSSVWIAHLRNMQIPAVVKLRAIADPLDIIVGDIVLLEVLQGARDDAHAAAIERNLRQFEIAAMLDEGLAVRAARYYRISRGHGSQDDRRDHRRILPGARMRASPRRPRFRTHGAIPGSSRRVSLERITVGAM